MKIIPVDITNEEIEFSMNELGLSFSDAVMRMALTNNLTEEEVTNKLREDTYSVEAESLKQHERDIEEARRKAEYHEEYKLLEISYELLLIAKKLSKCTHGEEIVRKNAINAINTQAVSLLDTIEKEITRVYHDENDRLTYDTKESEIEARIDAENWAEENQSKKNGMAEFYDEEFDQGQGTYLSDGVYVRADGSLYDSKS